VVAVAAFFLDICCDRIYVEANPQSSIPVVGRHLRAIGSYINVQQNPWVVKAMDRISGSDAAKALEDHWGYAGMAAAACSWMLVNKATNGQLAISYPNAPRVLAAIANPKFAALHYNVAEGHNHGHAQAALQHRGRLRDDAGAALRAASGSPLPRHGRHSVLQLAVPPLPVV